jgi:hypothetical protein
MRTLRMSGTLHYANLYRVWPFWTEDSNTFLEKTLAFFYL